MDEADSAFKIIVIGDSGVGKSTVVYKFVHGDRRILRK